MPDNTPLTSRVSVVVRDPARMTELIRSHRPLRAVGAAAGVSANLVSEFAKGRIGRVHLETATALERALGQEPGALFKVDRNTAQALRPYLH